jgi:hypothetical protein
MEKDKTTAGAEHVLAHGTPRTRAAQEKGGGKEAGGKDGEGHAEGKKRIKSIEVERAHDNTYMIKHKHHPPHQAEEHDETATAPDMEALKAHLEEHLGGSGAGGEAGESGEEAAAEQNMEAGGEGTPAKASAG